jgi:hypothetical protein
MISGMIRRFAGTAVAASMIAGAGLSFVGTPVTASAAIVGGCTVSGSAGINPGLGAVPGPQTVAYAGVAANCQGVGVVNGNFNGGITCALGNLATCVPFANFGISASPYGSCSGGVLLQQGVIVETECSIGTGAVVSVDVFTSNNGTNLPVTSVNFLGAAAGAEG